MMNTQEKETHHPAVIPEEKKESGNSQAKALITINVPWESMNMIEAQHYYGRLKAEFERAGQILNARTCAETQERYICFMAGKPGACEKGTVRTGRPRGIDYAHKDKNGLLKPAKICSERCWILYQNELIRERQERELS